MAEETEAAPEAAVAVAGVETLIVALLVAIAVAAVEHARAATALELLDALV